MKRSLIWLAMLATACNSATTTTTPPNAEVTPKPSAPRAVAVTPASPAGRSPAAAKPVAAMSTIPAGARFSIFCDSFSGPDHFAESNALKNLLVKNSQLRDWYVVHQDAQSTLYEGYFKEFNPAVPNLDKATAADAQRARREKTLVEAIPNPRAPDQKLFPHALFVPLDSPDPDAPPEWSLTNAQGYWSVQVAAFTGYDRKQKTIEAVRQARAMNPPVPAYYYHGDANSNISIVCVGSWPAEAIKRQGQSDTSVGTDQSQTLVVDAGENPLSAAQVAQMTGNNANVRVLKAKLDIVDPTLEQTLKDYAAQAVDGFEQMVPSQDDKGNPIMVPRPSMIVPIPHNLSGTAAKNATDDSEPTLLNPNGDARGLGARLKGIGQ